MTAWRRPRAGLVAGAAVALVVWAVLTGTATAHAQLLGTDPAPSSVLLVPPRQVVLTFDVPVSLDPGSVRVTGPTGARVDDGGAHHPGGAARAAAVGLPAGLARGSVLLATFLLPGADLAGVPADPLSAALRVSAVAGSRRPVCRRAAWPDRRPAGPRSARGGRPGWPRGAARR